MDYLPKLTAKEVQDILKKHDEELASIQEKLYKARKEIKRMDELIEAVSFHSKISGMPKGKGTHKDLGDVWLKYRKARQQRMEDYEQFISELYMREETIERVWMAHFILDEPYYTYVRKLYVERQKYTVVEKESGFSSQVFEKYRKHAIELVTKYYESDESFAQLMERSERAEKQRKAAKKTDEGDGSYQISMEDWMKGE